MRHLKVNEVLLRVSYDGKPRSFHEVRLLLDEVVTANFEGRWRELIGQLKGNVVWSVLKSITGLQGRRLPGGSTQSPPPQINRPTSWSIHRLKNLERVRTKGHALRTSPSRSPRMRTRSAMTTMTTE